MLTLNPKQEADDTIEALQREIDEFEALRKQFVDTDNVNKPPPMPTPPAGQCEVRCKSRNVS